MNVIAQKTADLKLRLFASAALHPGLRALLMLDVSSDEIDSSASVIKHFLAAATGQDVDTVELASYMQDEDLWGRCEGLGAPWEHAGLLSGSKSEESLRLVVVRNLAGLERVQSRAMVQLMESQEARIERYGQSRIFRPRIFWLAALQTKDAGMVSTHLLDRFPLRLRGAKIAPTVDRLSTLEAFVDQENDKPVSNEDHFPQDVENLCNRIRDNKGQWPHVPGDVIAEAETLISGHEGTGLRRLLGLLRLTAALACLEGCSFAKREHLEGPKGAAVILGLKNQAPLLTGEEPSERKAESGKEKYKIKKSLTTSDKTKRDEEEQFQSDVQEQPEEGHENEAYLGDEEPARLEPLELSDSSFPEDTASVQHEHAALRPPVVTHKRKSEDRGPAVGLRQAAGLNDFAIQPTLYAAAPYQAVRHKNQPHIPDHILIIHESDLKAWRREPAPSDLLAIVLDITALQGIDWMKSLLPYLRGAYQRRSSVCLVVVGAKPLEDNLASELQAQRITARNVLVPELYTAFERKCGRATPLAHGLKLVEQTISEQLHHGRGAIDRALLVVLSDGRGNVPLKVSQSGEIGVIETSSPRQGLEDAIDGARIIARMNQVERVFLHPEPIYGRHLTEAFAQALDARTEVIGGKD